MELYRKAYDKLRKWKLESKGASAILIEGARRVGKSYLARNFAEKEYQSYIYIDFADVRKEIIDVFCHWVWICGERIESIDDKMGRKGLEEGGCKVDEDRAKLEQN